MGRFLDRLAASVASRFVDWISARVVESQRDWALALSSELTAIDGGWRKLAWAIGGIPLAWKFGRWRAARRQSQRRRTQMGDPLPLPRRSSFDSFVLNVAALLAWWMGGFLWVRSVFPDGVKYWVEGDLTILVLSLAGALVALAIRRNGAAYVLAGLGVYQAVEFGFHSVLGVQVVQGGPAHFADMMAAILGVAISALRESGARAAGDQPVWNANDIGDSIRYLGRSIRRRLGVPSHMVFALVAFATAEATVRIELAWQVNLVTLNGWRWRHIFFDGQTNYAILACACVGSVLGAAVGRWGDRVALPMLFRRSASLGAPT